MSLLKEIVKSFPQITNPIWRLNNFYFIKDYAGRKVKFKVNWAQKEIIDNPHNMEIVLKCRQIGMTTFYVLRALDRILWEENRQAGIIAQTLDDTSRIFKDKILYAYENLDPRLKPFFKTVGESTKELAFTHGSSIRVGTSLRSSTLQDLHISEFGKICARDPERAREIITGSLNTVHAGQNVVIESTAEGREGRFYDMCQAAEKHEGTLGVFDYLFRFFPWYKHPEYIYPYPVRIPDPLEEYFARVELRGLKLSDHQKWWYVKKHETQKDDMLREYPTFSDEAFAASQEGYWYVDIMRDIRRDGHVDKISYDRSIPVHVAWDLGQADYQCLWFFQVNRQGEIRLIDYLQKKNFDLQQTVAYLQSRGYAYGSHIWPHDAKSRDKAGISFVEQADKLNLHGIVLERSDKQNMIRLVRATLTKCWFDENKCKEGLLALENYKKTWSPTIGGYTKEPFHDDSSHGADAFAYLCMGLPFLSDGKALKEDYDALRKFWG